MQDSTTPDGEPVVAASAAMRDVLEQARRVAATRSVTALILGESGVGKEVVAQHIHACSVRRGPMVAINLAALPETMAEAELFGAERGSYTGADRDRVGMFAAADGGTLLLDELGELSLRLQPKLLRVLEERAYTPLGSMRARPVDVRVVAATNREPAEAIAEGLLRPDLFYRVSTVIIRIPPLRERPEDILPLARRFLHAIAGECGRTLALGPDGEAALLAYPWPGNVRELRNVIGNAAIMAPTDVIGVGDLRLGATGVGACDPAEALALHSVTQRAVSVVERHHIERVVRQAGSATRAAELLQISRTTLWQKLRQYGLAIPARR